MALSCIVFDCDGVVLESVDSKNRAFSKVCDEVAPDFTARFTAYAARNGGVSRVERFAWLVRERFGRDITPEETRTMCEKLTAYSFDAVLESPLVPGFLDVAESRLGKTPMYVASGTPHYELAEILTRRGLDRYFAGIFGSPPAKAALLTSILRSVGVDPRSAVMVGDSKVDADAALIAGAKFYGRGKFFASGPHPWGEDLAGLAAFLEAVESE